MYNEAERFPDNETLLFLAGPAGRLEAIAATPGAEPLQAVTAIICHPHPEQEGTMHNKVVTTLHRACRDNGIRTVRFNYRGVGQSEGHFGHVVGETADLMAVIAWVKRVRPADNLWLMGFSFGAGIVLQAAASQMAAIRYLVCVAPPVDRDYFQASSPKDCPWLVIQGQEDEVVDPIAVKQWVENITDNKPAFHFLPQVGHFFHGKLVLLREEISSELIKQLPSASLT